MVIIVVVDCNAAPHCWCRRVDRHGPVCSRLGGSFSLASVVSPPLRFTLLRELSQERGISGQFDLASRCRCRRYLHVRNSRQIPPRPWNRNRRARRESSNARRRILSRHDKLRLLDHRLIRIAPERIPHSAMIQVVHAQGGEGDAVRLLDVDVRVLAQRHAVVEMQQGGGVGMRVGRVDREVLSAVSSLFLLLWELG
jgi:hypothetical protein